MEESRFVKGVWRFNSFAIMIVCILLTAFLGVIGYHLIKETFNKPYAIKTIERKTPETSGPVKKFGNIRSITGTPYVMVAATGPEYKRSAGINTNNYLFIDGTSNEAHWLLPDNSSAIIENELIRSGGSSDYDSDVLAILYAVVTRDTNGDKLLRESDKKNIALSLPSGRGYTEIAQDIDIFIDHALVGSDRVMIMYQAGETAYSILVSLPDFSILKKTQLPETSDVEE